MTAHILIGIRAGESQDTGVSAAGRVRVTPHTAAIGLLDTILHSCNMT